MNNINKDKLTNKIEEKHIKSTYNMDKDEFNNLLNIIVENLLKDEKAKTILKEEFKANENKLNKIKENIINKYNDIEINMYTSFLFSLDKITINTKTNHIELLLDDTNELKVERNSKEILSASFNNTFVKTVFNRKDKKFEADLRIDTSRDEVNLDGTVNFKEENDDYIKLDVSLSTLLNEKTNKYDTSPAKSFNQFTSKDLKALDKIIGIANRYIELLTGNANKKITLKK